MSDNETEVEGMPAFAALPASEMVALRNAAIRYFYTRVLRQEEKSRTGPIRLYMDKSYASLESAMKQVLKQMRIEVE